LSGALLCICKFGKALMDRRGTRLSRCFLAAFPRLKKEQIALASVETVDEWDSIAGATLLALIEEEFEIQFDVEALDRLDSFEAILEYLNGLPTHR
jgi:acyl carrier protein